MKKMFFRFFALFVLAILLISFSKPIGKKFFPIEHFGIASKYSKIYNIDTYLIMAIIKTESNFEKKATSKKDAMGLMQMTPSTGEWVAEKLNISNFNKEMLLDEETNIKFGCWYINDLKNEFGIQDNYLAAYNAGRGNVRKWLSDKKYSIDGKKLNYIPFLETDQYIKKVDFFYRVYKYLYT